MPTDRTILRTGIKYLAWALPLFFIGPSVIYSSFKNQDHVLFLPILGLGIILAFLAVLLLFNGLRHIVRSMTDK